MNNQKHCPLLDALEQELDKKVASGHFRRSKTMEASLDFMTTRYLTARDGSYISFVIFHQDNNHTLRVSHSNKNLTDAEQEKDHLRFDNIRTGWLGYLELWCKQHEPAIATGLPECRP